MISVLYVDDEASLLEVAQIFLEKSGKFKVGTSTSALEALASPAIQSYDAIVSDYQMPGMDGIAFLKEVRKRFGNMPFILFTGRGREEIVIQALNEGADFYLQKGGEPVSQFAELAHKIRQAVLQRRAEARIRDHERRVADILNFLPDATFAIDMNSVVIAWNRAMEMMTGVQSADIIGKGNFEYAIPFYHERRPILIDLVLHNNPATTVRYPFIKREGKTLFSEITIPHFNGGRGAALWFTASPLYDMQGTIVGAIELIRDITDRKRAEEARYESEERYRNIVEDQTEFISRFLPDGTHVFVNEAYCRYFGFRRDEILGHRFRPRIFPEDRDRVRQFFSSLTPDHPVDSIDQRIIMPDGRIRWQRWSDRAIFDPSGTVLEYQSVGRDITETKEAEEALRESRERFLRIFEDSPLGIAIVSPDFIFRMVNRRFCEMLKYREEELLAKSFTDITHPDHIASDVTESRRVFSGESDRYKTEKRYVKKDGAILWASLTASPVKDETGRVLYTIALIEDITERKREEQVLHENEQRLTSIYNTVGDSIFQLTVEPHEQYRFTSINSAFSRTTGLPPELVIGKKVTEIIPEPSLSMVLEKYRQAIEENAIVRWEETSNYPSGRLTGEVSIAPIFDEANNCTHLIGSVHDITARKKGEETLLRSQEQLELALWGADEGIVDFDLVRGTLKTDAHTPAILGYRPEDFPATINAYIDLIHPDDRDGSFHTYADLRDGKIASFDYQQRMLAPSNEWRWILIRGKVVERDNEGKPLRLVGTFRDITRRKQAEETIRESEQQFRALVENSLDGILIMDFTGIILFANRAAGLIADSPDFEAMLEKSNILEFVSTESRDDVLRDLSNVVQGIDTYLVNYKLITRTKREIWVECISKKIPFRKSEAVLVSLRDITERKKGEEQLRESENKLATLFRNNPVALTLVSAADGKFVDINETFVKKTGFAREDVIGKTAIEVGFFADTGDYERMTSAIRNRQEVWGWEIVCLTRAGEERTCLFSSRLIMMQGIPHVISTIEDITERKKAETALQAIVRSIVGATGLGSLKKITENISSWLGAECVMVGEIQPDHETVKVLSMILDGKDVADFTYHLRGTPCADVEKKGFCHYPDNSVQLFPDAKDIVELNIRGYVGTPLKNSEGKVVGILCALSRNPIATSPSIQEILDIIAVKAAAEIERNYIERALSESRKMLTEAMDLAHLVNWEFDVPTGMFTFNDRFYALYGTTAEREGGHLMSAETYAREFVHPEDRHMVGEEVERAMTTTDPGYAARLEHRIIRRDGEIRHIVVRIRITKDAEGKTIQTHGANQDITEIKKAEEALRESEEKFRSLVETSPGMIWEIDLEGTFRYISPIFQSIMGYTPEEMYGRQITDLIPEEKRSNVRKELGQHVSADGAIAPFEVPARHRDGHDLVIEIRPSRITGADGKLVGLRGMAYDITERKKAEEALRLANRQLNLLGSITRHDLQNKITVILGYLKIAEKNNTDPGLAEYLVKMRSATSVIKSQIDFTRIYQKLGTHEPQWISLDTIMPRSYLPANISLNMDVPNLQIRADPMLEKVFFNLLDNSIRHGKRVTEIRVSSHKSGDDMVIEWEDNGTGIPADDKEHIFERGFGENTGLGMFLVREILSLTGITIRETGEPGKGARFEIVVPKDAYRIA